MKSLLRNIVPRQLIGHYRHLKRLYRRRLNQNKTAEEVFTEIYSSNKWGGSRGEFCSGSGSTNEEVVSQYISLIRQKSFSENFFGQAFVDLGCGDFRVGKHLIPLCSSYVGVDVVKPLIKRNQELYGGDKAAFLFLDIAKDQLPPGDVCFVRQVLQHLSNEQILAVVQKLAVYKLVFITEHYPSDNDSIKPNKNKPHGDDIRAYDNSGVYLNEPPYNLSSEEFKEVLAVIGPNYGNGSDPGVIRTFLYKPKSHSMQCDPPA
jgi:SAM-dependent methyltransferase